MDEFAQDIISLDDRMSDLVKIIKEYTEVAVYNIKVFNNRFNKLIADFKDVKLYINKGFVEMFDGIIIIILIEKSKGKGKVLISIPGYFLNNTRNVIVIYYIMLCYSCNPINREPNFFIY